MGEKLQSGKKSCFSSLKHQKLTFRQVILSFVFFSRCNMVPRVSIKAKEMIQVALFVHQ